MKPWEADSADPHLAPLGFESAVGTGQALPGKPAALLAAGVVAPAGAKFVVQRAERASGGGGAAPVSGATPVIAVAPARPLAFTETPSSPEGPAPESGTGDVVPSDGATTVEAPSEGTTSPVAVPVSADGGRPGGPIAAGGGPAPESCEGDEYVVTITFLDEETVGEESPVEILLQRFSEDGSVDELELEGDLADARSLVLKLGSEGHCVQVKVEPPEEEEPETGEEVPVELPEPVSP